MPAIKVIDREPRQPRRRPKLWETFGLIGINPTDIKEGKGIYYAIIKQEHIESVINDESKQVFNQNGFDIVTPIEFDAMRSVVVRHIDKVIAEYTDEDIIGSINHANIWADVDSIVRIHSNGRLLKVKFKSISMAQTAMTEGMVVLHQRINAKNIEKEIFIRLTPCYNCFKYDHKTRECPQESRVLCSFCSGEGHKYSECTNQNPKCLNCGGNHRTLAAVCKVRRELIKEKSKEVRTRSRSRSQHRQPYANIVTGGASQSQTTQPIDINVNREETKNIIAKVITSIAYAHYIEAFSPGTFQQNINEIFELNNIPRLNFPQNIITEEMREIYKDIMKTNITTETPAPRDTKTAGDKDTGEEIMEIEKSKRSRESSEFSAHQNVEKRMRETSISHDSRQPLKTQPEYALPPPMQPRSRPSSPMGTREGERPEREPTQSQPGSTQTRTKPQEKKESTGKLTVNVKQLGITVYFRKTSKYIIDTSNPERKEILRAAIVRGEAKIQWIHPVAAYEAIFGGIASKFIKLEEVKIIKIADKDFDKMKNRCINS